MTRIAYPGRGLVRCLSLAAAAVLMLAAAPGQRAEAMSLITPSASPAATSAAEGVVIETRGGHGGGGHGGGGHGGGFHGGGGGVHFGGGGWHGGGMHGGGFHSGGFRFAHFHRHFFGGYYYPYYDYPYYPACRVVWTAYGPRHICWHRHRHYWHRWHHRHHHHY